MLIVQSVSDLSHIRSESLHILIQNRIIQIGDGFTAIVVEPEDSLSFLESIFPLFSNPINDTVYGDEDFVPMTEIIEDHDFCYELVFILSDDDAGTGLFVPKSSAIDPTLLALCAEFAIPATVSC
jgi:hypothetical protein